MRRSREANEQPPATAGGTDSLFALHESGFSAMNQRESSDQLFGEGVGNAERHCLAINFAFETNGVAGSLTLTNWSTVFWGLYSRYIEPAVSINCDSSGYGRKSTIVFDVGASGCDLHADVLSTPLAQRQ